MTPAGILHAPFAFLVNPLLLWGGIALAAIPIIIHLLNRRRVRTVRWAAMDWLLAALKRHQRRLRIENWLILFLRCAAVVLLGLALARPVLTDSALAGLFGQKRSIYLVLDTSYSTEAKSAARTVLERVKHEAGRVLDSLNKEDAVTVVVTNDPDEDNSDGLAPSVLVPRTIGTEGRTRAKEVVAKMRPRHAPAGWGETLDVVRAQMQPEDVNRQLIVITDLQATDWLQRARVLAEGTTGDATVGGTRVSDQLRVLLRQATQIQIVNVGGETRRNLSISSLHAHADRGAFVGRPLRLDIEVSNHGDQAVNGAVVEVFVDGRREPTRTVPTIPGADLALGRPGVEKINVQLSRTTFERPGSHEIRVKVGPPAGDPEADSLALDSERVLSVSVRRRIQVVALTTDSRPPPNTRLRVKPYAALTYLSGIYEGDRPGDITDITALGSLYSFDAVAMEPQLLARLRARDTNPVDLVVLCNRPLADANLIEALRDFVRTGGGLLVFTGDQFAGSPAAFNEAFHPELPEHQLCPFALGPAELKRLGETSFHFDFDRDDSKHPLAGPFTGPDAEMWIKRNPPQVRGRTPFIEPTRPTPVPGTPDPGGSTDDPPGEQPNPGHVVLRFEDEGGKPAIVAGTFGEGRTLWVGTSIDDGWMSNHVFPFLPVFLEEGALWLTQPRDEGRNLAVGDIIARMLPPGAEEPRFSIPGGAQVGPSRRTDDERTGRSEISYDTVGVAGMWKLTYGVPEASGAVKKVVDMIAVNPDPRESALGAADPRDVRGDIPPERPLSFHTSYGDTAEELQEVREGEITRWVLWILLGLLVIESILAWRFGRRRGGSVEGAS
ncbi:MAG: BatA domain-containing protein [Planctomycetota bacterium]|nr:BatA domain-containing protein [Planctomycetota bacterium]